jgi:glycine betaine/choline ABC-type transport system substrate-binding protein
MSPHPLSPSPLRCAQGKLFGRGGTPGRPRWSLGLVALLLTGCAQRDRIVVGSKNFTESDLLGEIVAQQIERRTAFPVERRFHLGGTFVCHEAITSGQIDLYVEYTGTAFTAVLKHAPVADRDSVYRTVARDYAQRFGLVWGEPFGFNNTFAISVRRRDATQHGLTRISDLARVAPRWKAGFGYEFLERADGFRGLARVYGLRFAAPPTAMDLGLTYRALAEGKVDVIAGNSTDGQIQALDLVVLEDDRHYFPPYEAAPVMRHAVVARHAEIATALAQLAGRISDAEMRRLNALADVEHRDIATIARDWLRATVP